MQQGKTVIWVSLGEVLKALERGDAPPSDEFFILMALQNDGAYAPRYPEAILGAVNRRIEAARADVRATTLQGDDDDFVVMEDDVPYATEIHRLNALLLGHDKVLFPVVRVDAVGVGAYLRAIVEKYNLPYEVIGL